jgi:hypothetical protein
MTVKILSASSAATDRFFPLIMKPGKSSLYQLFIRIFINSQCFHRSSFKMYISIYKELKNKNIKTISGLAESTGLFYRP